MINHMSKSLEELKVKYPSEKMTADQAMSPLICQNKILFNSDMSKFSLIPLEGFNDWQWYMDNDLKGYKLSDKFTLIPDTVP